MTNQIKATEQYFHDLRFDIKGVRVLLGWFYLLASLLKNTCNR